MTCQDILQCEMDENDDEQSGKNKRLELEMSTSLISQQAGTNIHLLSAETDTSQYL